MLKTHCIRGHEFTLENTYIRKDRPRRLCRQCMKIINKRVVRGDRSEYYKQLREIKKDHFRNYDLKRNYNITLEEYNEKLLEQDNKCAICNTDVPGGRYNKFVVDHDHNCCPTKRGCCGQCNRDLICSNCNLVLGQVDDDIELLQKMIQYLEHHRSII